VSFDPNRPAAPEPYTPATPEPSVVPTTPVPPAPVSAAPPVVPVARRSSGAGGRWLNLLLVLAAAVAIGGIAFAVGRTTAPVSATTGNGRTGVAGGAGFPRGSFAPGASGQPGFGRGGFGGGGAGLTINGTVVSVSGDTLTIKTATGQTIEVTTGASTTYHTESAATASDVQAGKNVQVQLDFGGGAGRPSASATTTGPVGTAGSVTVIP
jgi:hypothetical protein